MASYVDLLSIHNPATGTAPPATWGDQIRENEEYNYQRGPYICTAATHPGSPFEGQVIYETDTDKYFSYTGSAFVQMLATGAWTSWTPILVQPSTVTQTTTYAKYQKIGRLVIGQYYLSVTGTGTSTNPIAVSLPFTAAIGAVIFPIGSGFVYDSSATNYYHGTLALVNATNAGVLATTPAAAANAFVGSAGMTAGLASGDLVMGSFAYEATT